MVLNSSKEYNNRDIDSFEIHDILKGDMCKVLLRMAEVLRMTLRKSAAVVAVQLR
jgi:hypothetical protein